ncbi:zinc finger protein OZF-like [Lutzomyia longipalpis]|uniref:zinc finger protein OZF-like n=1 Tax=Lutzomyia longipalpis TaxID=7200 RepID=UPI002483A9F5|nr:zinc finger protein OZF-like [Lutzomyia longipalpis]
MKFSEYCCSCFAKNTPSTSIRSPFEGDHTISSAFLQIFSKDLLSSVSSVFTENMCDACIGQFRSTFKFWTKCEEAQKNFSVLLEERKIPAVQDNEAADGGSSNADEDEEAAEEININSAASLKDHMDDIHKDPSKELLCDICDFMTTKKSKLASHMLQHRKEKSFICRECKKVYSTRSAWKKHMNNVHLGGTKVPSINNFLCSICGKNFGTRQRLQHHTVTHTGEKKFPCTLCDKTFATSSRLKNHIRVHTGERPYKCECGKSFSQRNVLVCHRRLHTGEKPFQCSICQKAFRQYATLKTHMAIHTGKPIECPDCKKTFCRISFLHVHMRKHTGEKPYACDRCPNRYRQKCHLDQHMDTHDGVKYQCEVCKKEYSKRWSLKIHMYTHTEGTRFKCPDCDSSFVRKDKYKRHLRTVHGKDMESPSNKYILVPGSENINAVTYQLVQVPQEAQLTIVGDDESGGMLIN